MAVSDVLEKLWEKENRYGLVEETILIESTFMQQTSRNSDLWKAQLGLTKNYAIFLRCVMDPAIHGSEANNSFHEISLLLNIIPKKALKVKKHAFRKLKIIFPSGCICYFKLLIRRNSVDMWLAWEALEGICDSGTPLHTQTSRLIPLSELDHDIQQILKDGQFLESFSAAKKYPRRDSDTTVKLLSDSEYHPLQSDSCEKVERTAVSKPSDRVSDLSTRECNRTVLSKGVANSEPEKSSNATSGNGKNLSRRRKNKKNRKHRTVKRFGDGIPEGCSFELSFSYSDEIVDDNIKVHEEKQKTGASKESTILIGAENLDKKVDKIHYDQGSLRWEHFLPNISLIVIPGGLRRSKSVDSVQYVASQSQRSLSMAHFNSLPDVHDVCLYRRWNRLSFAMDHFADEKIRSTAAHAACSISFWMPSPVRISGTIYCTSPLCRQKAAEQLRDCFYGSMKEFSEEANLSDSFMIFRRIIGKKAKNEVHREDSSVTIRASYMASDVLESLDKEYPERQRICGTPPRQTKTKPNPSPQKDKETERKASVVGQPTVTLKPEVVAYELQRIQQRLFSEIETSEIARFILKPHTVSELNCSYLCGFLYFFERLKNLVISEILGQNSKEEAAETFRLFVQVALESWNRRDLQSACAITGALGSPSVMKGNFWPFLDERGYTKPFFNLYECWTSQDMEITSDTVPSFLSFITLVIKRFIEDSTTHAKFKRTPWVILDLFSRGSKYVIKKKVFSELRTLSYRNLGKLFNIIEDCRKYYNTDPLLTADIDTRNYLLFKQY